MHLGREPRIAEIERYRVADDPPGTSGPLWLAAGSGVVEPTLVPALAARGRGDGPTLLVAAGVHGDEYEGMEAVRRLFARLDPEAMTGSFLGVLATNPFATEARARSTPVDRDGLNLARAFPGDREGSPTRRLAASLLALVERNVGARDLFLDFHSGSADVAFATVVGVRDVPGPTRVRSEAAARAFGVRDLWLIPDADGPFNAETARRGIPTIATETTGRAGCLERDVNVFEQGLRQLLGFLGIVAGQPAPLPVRSAFRPTIDLISPASGFLRGFPDLHDRVEAGQRVGEIVDVFGTVVAEVCSLVTGVVWAARATPAVRQGELLGMVAMDDARGGPTEAGGDG